MSVSANDIMGKQLSLSQTDIISQSEVKWGGSWKYVLQLAAVCTLQHNTITGSNNHSWQSVINDWPCVKIKLEIHMCMFISDKTVNGQKLDTGKWL